MTLTPEQLATRASRIGGTDIAAIVGLHPKHRPINVYMEKTGRAAPFVGNVRTRWGHILETPIREDYEERHQVIVEVPGTLVHPSHDWWSASPDGVVYRRQSQHRRPERGLEIKTHGRDAIIFGGLEYGQQGTDEVPLHELLQCVWGMGCTGLDRWDLIAFIDGAPNEYTIHRDDDLIGTLAEAAERFHRDHILADVPPEADGSKEWTNWIKRRWEKNNGNLVLIDKDGPTLDIVAEFRRALEAEADAQRAVETLKQRLKDVIADRDGLLFHEPDRPPRKPTSITWKKSRDGVKDNHFATAKAMRDAAAIVASGRGAAVSAACTALTNLDHEVAQEAAALLDEMYLTLTRVATQTTITTHAPGSRRFCKPRHWKKRRSDDHDDDDNHEEN